MVLESTRLAQVAFIHCLHPSCLYLAPVPATSHFSLAWWYVDALSKSLISASEIQKAFESRHISFRPNQAGPLSDFKNLRIHCLSRTALHPDEPSSDWIRPGCGGQLHMVLCWKVPDWIRLPWLISLSQQSYLAVYFLALAPASPVCLCFSLVTSEIQRCS